MAVKFAVLDDKKNTDQLKLAKLLLNAARDGDKPPAFLAIRGEKGPTIVIGKASPEILLTETRKSMGTVKIVSKGVVTTDGSTATLYADEPDTLNPTKLKPLFHGTGITEIAVQSAPAEDSAALDRPGEGEPIDGSGGKGDKNGGGGNGGGNGAGQKLQNNGGDDDLDDFVDLGTKNEGDDDDEDPNRPRQKPTLIDEVILLNDYDKIRSRIVKAIKKLCDEQTRNRDVAEQWWRIYGTLISSDSKMPVPELLRIYKLTIKKFGSVQLSNVKGQQSNNPPNDTNIQERNQISENEFSDIESEFEILPGNGGGDDAPMTPLDHALTLNNDQKMRERLINEIKKICDNCEWKKQRAEQFFKEMMISIALFEDDSDLDIKYFVNQYSIAKRRFGGQEMRPMQQKNNNNDRGGTAGNATIHYQPQIVEDYAPSMRNNGTVDNNIQGGGHEDDDLDFELIEGGELSEQQQLSLKKNQERENDLKNKYQPLINKNLIEVEKLYDKLLYIMGQKRFDTNEFALIIEERFQQIRSLSDIGVYEGALQDLSLLEEGLHMVARNFQSLGGGATSTFGCVLTPRLEGNHLKLAIGEGIKELNELMEKLAHANLPEEELLRLKQTYHSELDAFKKLTALPDKLWQRLLRVLRIFRQTAQRLAESEKHDK